MLMGSYRMLEETKEVQSKDHENAHFLNSKWCTWLRDRAEGNRDEFEKSLNIMCFCDTLETFFVNYVHSKRPSQIDFNADIFLFREEEKPMWEKCPKGCTLVIKLQRDNKHLNYFWEKLCFMCIGEILEDLNIIGAGISLRRNNCALLEIWNKDLEQLPSMSPTNQTSKFRRGFGSSSNDAFKENLSNEKLSRKVISYLGMTDEDDYSVYFKNHSEALKDSSNTKTSQVLGDMRSRRGRRYYQNHRSNSISYQNRGYSSRRRFRESSTQEARFHHLR
ncbi:unnamed protein product [Moneuplotes crassus]|uniref:Eukaryotic translation initiation factor 4E n=1 Tax=Euplotes crassus TaxID=5936 RepID=A0AAD1XM53_EUPCR|nr:unnamed protein product [Moneuplotes crassus]